MSLFSKTCGYSKINNAEREYHEVKNLYGNIPSILKRTYEIQFS